MDEEQIESPLVIDPPFEKLYVAVVGKTKRAYPKQGPARARITNAVARYTDLFEEDCELWEVSEAGWELIFMCSEGDHSDLIPWNEIAKTRKAEAERLRRWHAEQKYEMERREYERLKKRFG